jgi:hypothetical protein
VRIISRVLCVAFLTAFLSSTSDAQNKTNAAYYCTAEASGGLAYNNVLKKWEGVAFPVTHKFILRLKFVRTYVRRKENEFDKDETGNYYETTITDAGESFASPCVSYYGNAKEVWVSENINTVFCEAALVEYKFNLNRNRYLGTYSVGYAVGLGSDDEHSDTPAIEGGTCTKIE